jgi:hypothetical protein
VRSDHFEKVTEAERFDVDVGLAQMSSRRLRAAFPAFFR